MSSRLSRQKELSRFRRLGVPVVPSSHTLEPEIPPLLCPRGYRLPNMSLMEHGIIVASFYIDDLDGALTREEAVASVH